MGLIQDTIDLAAIADKIRDDVERSENGEEHRLPEVWKRIDGLCDFATKIKDQYGPKKKAPIATNRPKKANKKK